MSFLRRTSFAAITLPIIGCSSPTKMQSEALYLGHRNALESVTDIQSYICQGRRQSRPLKMNFAYILPQNKKGKSLDLTAKDAKYFNDRKYELLREMFYLVSSIDHSFVKFAKMNRGEVIDRAKSINNSIWLNPSQVYLEYKLSPQLIISDEGSKIAFIEKVVTSSSMETYGDDFTKIKEAEALVEVSALTNNYTILEPKEFQQKSYAVEQDSASSSSCDKDHLMALDENGNVDVDRAKKCRDKIWQRYIRKFTNIKEASTIDPQVLNVELSLDLNPFCQYGRKISDLESI